jgi:hypothetical protein
MRRLPFLPLAIGRDVLFWADCARTRRAEELRFRSRGMQAEADRARQRAETAEGLVARYALAGGAEGRA